MSGLVTFRQLTPAEVEEHDRQAHAWLAEVAWGWWRQYQCTESRRAPDGEHPWVLEVDEGHASIKCEHGCGASPLGPDDDVYVNVSVPVTVDIQAVSGWTPYGTEYDMEVQIDPDPDRIDATAADGDR